MQNKRLLIIILVSIILLLIPLVAMQFTDEVNWTFFDFAVAEFLLLGTGLMCEFVMRRVNKRWYITICVTILIALLLVWTELAVGIA